MMEGVAGFRKVHRAKLRALHPPVRGRSPNVETELSELSELSRMVGRGSP
jgi:hypothetical protein